MQYTARKCGGARLVDNFTHIRTMTDKQPPPTEQPTHCARLSPYGRPAFIEREPDRDSERMEAQGEGRLMPTARVNFKG